MGRRTITVVSGLPRSGTSMMMKMLEAGGMEILTDHLREADRDNPRGYYEFERVKQLEHDKSWLPEAEGKAVKVISALLKHLPPEYHYKVIFMHRHMEEILASQREMLIRRGEDPDTVDDEQMSRLFSRHLETTTAWLATQPHMDVIHVSFNDIMADPMAHLPRVTAFLDNTLDVERMAGVIDPSLYRQRR
jgi:hypothetical protein